jgi:hypothetical protein
LNIGVRDAEKLRLEAMGRLVEASEEIRFCGQMTVDGHSEAPAPPEEGADLLSPRSLTNSPLPRMWLWAPE